MSIYKPQVPLAVGAENPRLIYPLTVAEQVIMEDGARLNAFHRFLPQVGAEDAGKILRVSPSGAWAADMVQNAEEVSF